MSRWMQVAGKGSPAGYLALLRSPDGAGGLAAIRETGGYTICQDEATSVVFGMPRAAIRLGDTDRRCPGKPPGENIGMNANLKAAEAAGTTVEAVRKFLEARGILQMIHTINESGRRVATIVGNMLGFARKNDAQMSSYPLSELH